jgi:histidinol-phosphate/aromatic aminotransferase/cobyric acid decarboxylase-like protein
MSLVAARAALCDQDYLRETVARIHDDCEEFYAALKALPRVEVYQSDANFFLVRLGVNNPQRLRDYLGARGLRVRSRPDMPQHIRITSLRPEDNHRLIATLNDYLQSAD